MKRNLVLPYLFALVLIACNIAPVHLLAGSPEIKMTDSGINELLRLKATGNGYQDETLIVFHPDATNGFDPQFDAYKIPGAYAAPQIYSIIPGYNLSVNVLPELQPDLTVQLGFEVGAATTYQISATEFQNFDPLQTVHLYDSLQNTYVNLRQQTTYSFSASPSDDPQRFKVIFNRQTPVDVTFLIDMSDRTVSPEGIHVAGNFQGWDPVSTPMIDIGGNVFAATVNLTSWDEHYYFFINGDELTEGETVPESCADSGYRFLRAPPFDSTLMAVCFGSCYSCNVPGYVLDLDVFLEGPFNEAACNMSTALNPDLPPEQPYDGGPWNYQGNESNASFDNTIVDWILVELRETGYSADSALAENKIFRGAFLLTEDGDILSKNMEMPRFYFPVQEDIYTVVRHRNHLDIMSAFPMTLVGDTLSYNFTSSSAQSLGGGNAVKQLGSCGYGMYAGDGDANGQVNNTDKNVVWNTQAGSSGFSSGDFNMDGQVDNTDKNVIWVPNSGNGSQVL